MKESNNLINKPLTVFFPCRYKNGEKTVKSEQKAGYPVNSKTARANELCSCCKLNSQTAEKRSRLVQTRTRIKGSLGYYCRIIIMSYKFFLSGI